MSQSVSLAQDVVSLTKTFHHWTITMILSFSVSVIVYLLAHIIQSNPVMHSLHHLRHFSTQLHVLSFSECLNTMLGVVVMGSVKREGKNKEI